MVEYIEAQGRVFRLEYTHDGANHGRVVITVESGPLLSDDEASALALRSVVELVSRGVVVTEWGWDDEDPGE